MITKTFSFIKNNLIVVFLLLTASVIAFSHMNQQTFFYYDQARDAYEAYGIWQNHDIKIVGPATDIEGVFHGALWYYFLSVFYAIGNNNPQSSMLLLFFLLFLTVPMVGILANTLFHSKKITTLSMVFYAFSPLFLLSSRWLSNPYMGMLVMPFLLYSFWQYCHKKSWKWAMLSGLLFGVLIQSDLAYVLLIFLLPVYIFYFKIYKNIKSIIVLFMSLLLVLSSYIISEFKFNGQSLKAAMNFLTDSDSNSIKTASNGMVYTFQKIAELLSNTVLSLHHEIIYVLMIVSGAALFFNRKNISFNKSVIFLLFWLSGLFVFLVFNTGISRSLFVFFPFLSPLVIAFSYVVASLFKKRMLFVVVGFLVLLQISKAYSYYNEVSNPLTVQKGMTLPIEKSVIDYTYTSSAGEMFQINTVTVPLYINTTWAYLYNFYGSPKYGYLPIWDGKDQTGRLGSLPTDNNGQAKYRYLIIEPSIGIPDFFIEQTILEENQISAILEEKRIGEFRIQKRQNKTKKE